MAAAALIIAFMLSGLTGLWVLWLLADWICHGCPARYPYDDA
jgi:hypothetical protein